MLTPFRSSEYNDFSPNLWDVTVPILQGGMQDDGSIFAVDDMDVGTFLNATFGPGTIKQAELAPLYPGLSGFQEISQITRDFGFLWYHKLSYQHTLILN